MRLKEGIVISENDEGYLLVDTGDGDQQGTLKLDNTEVFIVNQLKKENDMEGLIRAVRIKYEADEKSTARIVKDFVTKLTSLGLIR